jgi:hypothetical protein
MRAFWRRTACVTIVCVAALVGGGQARALASTAAAGTATQYTSRPEVAVDPAVGRLLAIAHNAGDYSLTTSRAISHRAGAVEIDVLRDGQLLIARHNGIRPVISARLPGGRPIGQAWDGAGTTPVLLDLKSTSSQAVGLVLAELNRHPGSRVLVSTTSGVALELLRRDAPDVTRLLTVKDEPTLQMVLAGSGGVGAAQGVSIREQLLTPDVISSLHAAHLFVQAWTVNDIVRVNDLARWGVDGVTADNLAVLDAISSSFGSGA